ncbi:MAG: methionyl-tRNA formyltransferase [Erysipelothrix sp.]|nr:methionyl-tRNA formyltransferase [Erysipelothrix sp.]
MSETRVIFMGTPIFAAEILEHLAGLDLNIVASVSQPDRPVGRKRIIEKTPVHLISEKLGITCVQPNNIKDAVEDITSYKPDIIITCAYGQIIPDAILNNPKCGAFNIHASLLPALRGGAPIHKSIMYGHDETGITIMEMVSKMDAGDMILKRSIPITNSHTTETLEKELIEEAKLAITEALPSLIDMTYKAEKQDETLVTYAFNISKEEEFISFDRDYDTVSAHIRSLIDRPVGFGLINDMKLKIHAIHETKDTYKADNGLIIGKHDGGLGVVIDNRILVLDQVQPVGKKVMSGLDYINGAGKQLIKVRFE